MKRQMGTCNQDKSSPLANNFVKHSQKHITIGWLIYSISITISLLASICLFLGFPTVQRLPVWFWPIANKPLPAELWMLIGLAAFAAATIVTVRWVPERSWASGIALLIMAGALQQFGFALAEGRGMEALRQRLVTTGHAEFARIAAQHNDMLAIVRNWQDFINEPDKGFSSTKPPGTVLVYIGLADLAEYVVPDPAPIDIADDIWLSARHWKIVSAAAIVFPIFASFVVIPLGHFTRLVFSDQNPLLPGLLYISAPSVSLITLHLDQALFPLLAATLFFLAAKTLSTKAQWRIFWGMIFGVSAYICVFISFSVLPAIPLAALIALISTRRLEWKILANASLSALAGFLSCYLLAMWILNFDALSDFQVSMRNHENWRWNDVSEMIHPPILFLIYSSILNLVEFFYWSGPSILGLMIWVGWDSIDYLRYKILDRTCIVWPFVLVVMIMLVTGRTISETARLWMFLLPACALIGAISFERLKYFPRLVSIVVLAATQAQLTIAIKSAADFG
jgi:hypothetical protein